MKSYDVVIIGSGPSGLYAGFYAGMRGLSALIIDELEICGGQLATLYPEKYIYDIAGIPKIKAKDLVNNLLTQLEHFDSTEFSLKTKVENVIKDDNGFNIATSKGNYYGKTVIIAAGNGAFSPRLLGVENEEELDCIDYFISDPQCYKDLDVTIFGGGDSAVDFALMIEKIAKSVNIVHRRDEFRAHSHSVNLLKQSTVNIYTPYVPNSIDGNSVKITSDTDTMELKFDKIICNYGFISNIGNIEQWNLNTENKKIIVDSFQETNIKGIFAIGDICSYPGRASMITCGFGEAPKAINACYMHINPGAKIGALHSSTKMEEK